jgi:hypothetical protein
MLQRLRGWQRLPACLGVAGGLIASVAIACGSANAHDLPERKPGHWRITSISAELGMTAIDACILPGDSIAVPSEGSTCSEPDVQRVEDQVIVNVTCKSKLGEERISTLFTGDFETWYRGITKMTFDPPTYGQAGMAVTVDAKFVSETCPSN